MAVPGFTAELSVVGSTRTHTVGSVGSGRCTTLVDAAQIAARPGRVEARFRLPPLLRIRESCIRWCNRKEGPFCMGGCLEHTFGDYSWCQRLCEAICLWKCARPGGL